MSIIKANIDSLAYCTAMTPAPIYIKAPSAGIWRNRERSNIIFFPINRLTFAATTFAVHPILFDSSQYGTELDILSRKQGHFVKQTFPMYRRERRGDLDTSDGGELYKLCSIRDGGPCTSCDIDCCRWRRVPSALEKFAIKARDINWDVIQQLCLPSRDATMLLTENRPLSCIKLVDYRYESELMPSIEPDKRHLLSEHRKQGMEIGLYVEPFDEDWKGHKLDLIASLRIDKLQ
ncbi:hypothetical protein CPB84DRAFT_1746736 [Gymnopilus junonius]|uniref:Uncharacterized protein n=1 Tax=Gymnopilus junonius TaxID=109634 RepID=A0A9P5NPK9_GYMJU|nr:hypothetical protein CPB84DRAFT_1746736 [Gymnopilus junonius]